MSHFLTGDNDSYWIIEAPEFDAFLLRHGVKDVMYDKIRSLYRRCFPKDTFWNEKILFSSESTLYIYIGKSFESVHGFPEPKYLKKLINHILSSATIASKKDVTLWSVCKDLSNAGRGKMGELLNLIIDHQRHIGTRTITLHVYFNNDYFLKAIRLYIAHGFTYTGYDDRGIIMSCALHTPIHLDEKQQNKKIQELMHFVTRLQHKR